MVHRISRLTLIAMKTIVHFIKNSSIKSRMIFSLVIILAVAFIITNYLNYRTSHLSVHDNLINSVLPLTRDNIYSEIQANIARPVFISSLMANDTFLKDWTINGEKNTETIKKYLRTIRKKYDFFSVFFVSARTGHYYHYRGILKTISRKDPHDVWFYKFIRQEREYGLDVDTDQASDNRMTVFINHRLLDYNGKLLGVTGVGLNMDRISSMIREYNRLYGCNIFLADRNGTVQVHSDEKVIEKLNINTIRGIGEFAPSILSDTQNTSFHEFEREGSHILLTARFIPEFDWFLFVEIDEKARMGSIISSTRTSIALSILLSFFVLATAVATANYFQNRITLMAVTDELTGVYNRKEFDVHSRKAIYSFHRSSAPFSLIIFDIDHFKEINDTHGHSTGDLVIRSIAEIASKTKRLTDVLVRWGGDEFIILTHGEIIQAVTAAERLCKHIAEHIFFTGEQPGERASFTATISCGVAAFRKGDSIDSVISRADTALYQAKAGGRNRVESEISTVPKKMKKKDMKVR